MIHYTPIHTSPKILAGMEGLFDFNSPRTYEKHLLEVWGSYLMHHTRHEHPSNFSEIAASMYHLLQFLQVAEKVLTDATDGP